MQRVPLPVGPVIFIAAVVLTIVGAIILGTVGNQAVPPRAPVHFPPALPPAQLQPVTPPGTTSGRGSDAHTTVTAGVK